MRVGFIVTVPYHLFHFGRIQKHFTDTVAYIEVRDRSFGLEKELVKKYLPGAEIKWVLSTELKKIDGECDVLVCQTPVPIMKFFSQSLVVAEQYSLAKEEYQYGLWRTHASVNLMYGPYSLTRVTGYCSATATGNPLLDDVFASGKRPTAPTLVDGTLRVLYMPTYGDLSDKSATVRALMEQGVELSIKAHHMDQEIISLADEFSLPILLSDSDPVEAICNSDVVVSDYSGAIYDALAVRKPVLLAASVNAESTDAGRLSEQDVSRSAVDALAVVWDGSGPILDAYRRSVEKLSSDESYARFLEKFYVNLGGAGAACAREIVRLAQEGEPKNPVIQRIREATRRYVLENRKLRAKLKKANVKKKFRRGGRLGDLNPLSRLFAALEHDSLRVVFLKMARWGLLRLPGGGTVLRGLRKLRGMPGGGSEHEQEVPVAEDLLPGLPRVPRLRREMVRGLLDGVLQQHGVEYRRSTFKNKIYFAVREEDSDQLCRALNDWGTSAHGEHVHAWMGVRTKYDKRRAVHALELRDVLACDSLVVGVPYRKGNYVVERSGGVEILLLTKRDVRLVAKRARAGKVDWTREFAEREAGAVKAVEPREVAKPHALQGAAIDVVYTWVDSTDQEWQRMRAEWSGQSTIEMESASNDERYLDREELRYSLRSIWAYAPFVRNIYIVTAGHSPAWLDKTVGNVHIVSHADIFPDQGDLPTFNSHSIEACLHRIPGIAEHFLYMNDDFFIGRDVDIEDFYTKSGLIKSRFSPSSFAAEVEPAADSIPTDWASYNAVQLIKRDFGLHFDRKMKHVPMPLTKSLLTEMEQRYPDIFRITRSSKFRAPTDFSIPSMLAHYYGVAVGKAVEWENIAGEYAYADSGRADFVGRLREIAKKKPTFFCLNVTRYADIDLDKQATLLRDFLDTQYPEPSPYERVGGVSGSATAPSISGMSGSATASST